MIEYDGYKLEHDGGFGMITIKPLGKGSVPKALGGQYTTYKFAKQAIDAHKSRGAANGKAKPDKGA